MRAIVCKQFGPPEQLVLEDVPAPAKLAPGDVHIRVHAVGVNFPDTLIIQGKYQFRAEPPFTPGGEVAGEVLAVGEKVKQFKPGDRVVTVQTHGGLAEEMVCTAMGVLPAPAGMDYVEAAAYPMAYGTSYYALKQRGRLKAGETLLVLGAAGGVGLTAVELGKLMGARVIAAASSDEKLAVCKQQGADEVINYAREDLKERVKALTKGQGADVIYDPVGGDFTQTSLSCINWDGRLLVIGFASGPIPSIAANRLLLKSCSLVGVFWGASMMREPQANMENFRQLAQWHAEGKLKPHVSKTYELKDASQALSDMLARKATGKLVVKVR
ncbi:MAG: NADPH:quinone oxidoreductase family protein [Nevskiales bacterium]